MADAVSVISPSTTTSSILTSGIRSLRAGAGLTPSLPCLAGICTSSIPSLSRRTNAYSSVRYNVVILFLLPSSQADCKPLHSWFPACLQQSYFLRQAQREQATRWAARGKFAGERRRRRFKSCHLERLGNGRFRPGAQLRRECHLDPSPRPNVVDVAISNGRFARLPLFQAQRLRAELDMFVEPVALVSMLVLLLAPRSHRQSRSGAALRCTGIDLWSQSPLLPSRV